MLGQGRPPVFLIMENEIVNNPDEIIELLKAILFALGVLCGISLIQIFKVRW